jgi:putative peptidoglycan lipid II flippase
VLAEPVVAVLLGHGEFGAEGIERTARALRVLCISLLPAGAVGLVGRAYYAIGDFKTPVRVSIGMLVLNIALNVLFLVVLGMDVEGLALSTALTSWGNLALLVPGLRSRLARPPQAPRGGPDLLRIAVATGALALLAAGLFGPLARLLGEALGLLATIACAGGGYALASELLAVPQWRQLRRRFRR